ncbi:MAG: FIST C-terminal domain-containing protein [Treponema sp.]|jgi:hypothetical protein|nr:FIST C-terminal domain-containing protein [Treponema sp.]
MKTMTAFTFEIDDPEAAAAEILEQIDIKGLGKSSLGILTCYTNFIDSGAVQTICEALPFDVIGMTTVGTVSSVALGEMALGLLVLTSDDVDFIVGAVGITGGDVDGPVCKAYEETSAKRPGQPVMALVFAPYIPGVVGESIAVSLDKASGGIPIFGSLAIDSSIVDFSFNRTIYNGEACEKKLVFALLYGDLRPSFFVTSFTEDKIQKQRGIVTKSKDNILMEVNNMPLLDYLQSLGIQKTEGAWTMSLFPFVLDYNDGTKPVVRSVFLITKEGYAACGGYIPENATLSVGGIDYPNIIRTTSEALEQILTKKKDDGGSCLLMFSCLGRYFALESHTTAEMETIRDILMDFPGYLFGYSGGEICPVYTEEGRAVNRFHNCTFIVCLL